MASAENSSKQMRSTGSVSTDTAKMSGPGDGAAVSPPPADSQDNSTSADRLQQIRALYEQALQREPNDRSVFLQQACQSDSALLSEVDKLLRCREEPPGFLDVALVDLLSSTRGSDNVGRVVEPWRAGQFEVLQEITTGRAGTAYLASSVEPGDSRFVTLLLPQPDCDMDGLERRLRQVTPSRQESGSNGPISWERGVSAKGAFLAVDGLEFFLAHGFLEVGIALCAIRDWGAAIPSLREAFDLLKSATKAESPEVTLAQAKACRYLGLASLNLEQATPGDGVSPSSNWIEARRWLKESLKAYSRMEVERNESEDVAAVLEQIKAEIARCDEALQGSIAKSKASKAASFSGS